MQWIPLENAICLLTSHRYLQAFVCVSFYCIKLSLSVKIVQSVLGDDMYVTSDFEIAGDFHIGNPCGYQVI